MIFLFLFLTYFTLYNRLEVLGFFFFSKLTSKYVDWLAGRWCD